MSLNGIKPPDSQEEAFSFTVQQLPEKEYAEPTTTRTGRFNPFKWILSISSSNYLVKSFEDFFRWEGETVSKNSIPVILISLLLGGLGCAGLPFLEQENNMIRLWIPQNSDTALNYAWLWSNYPPEFREHSIILHGDNVLTPPAIQKLYAIYKSVYSIKTEKFNKTWENSCFRRPVVKLTGEILSSRRKRDLWGEESAEDEFGFNNFDENFNTPADFSINNYPQPYCGMVESLPTACFEDSLLELWAFEGEFNHISDEKIAGLTTKEILDKVNNWGYSERFLNGKYF
ncbi:uncharacterized protein LOC111695326 [Eurytemora carolleeae]|uniref:uncharacterized protein LOC111695326 n=1 Tax=Eurytemora carolleeae TaxID=1294199 RepID=UPI000C785839|nr:uncharacterized protein LOC111695326 [Eurytemora carolleeae]|eukprot:XP_023320376.1 uncharacterized protein LOC111695326 [Eurytemora affinis]